MKQEKYEYKIRCINPSDYELKLTLHTENRLLKYIFQKSKQRLARIHNIQVKGNIDEVNEIEIPNNYLNLIKTNIYPIYKKQYKIFLEDGIQLLSYTVDKCHFERINGEWQIIIIITGVYIDKRTK